VDPIVGLQSAWIMGICTSLFGGRPGMVAGATGAVAVVLPSLVRDHGIGFMFYAIMFAGIIQMVFGFLCLGVLVRLIPHPVMVGFCNGLGIVIGVAQFNIFKVRPEDSSNNNQRSLMEIGGAFSPFTNGYPWVDATMGCWMTFHIIVALLTYAFFPKLTRAIPASLAAIIMTTILEWALVRPCGYRTNTVKDLASVSGSFPVPVWADSKNGYRDLMPPLTGMSSHSLFHKWSI
jgi:SulP family sulfate permease